MNLSKLNSHSNYFLLKFDFTNPNFIRILIERYKYLFLNIYLLYSFFQDYCFGHKLNLNFLIIKEQIIKIKIKWVVYLHIQYYCPNHDFKLNSNLLKSFMLQFVNYNYYLYKIHFYLINKFNTNLM